MTVCNAKNKWFYKYEFTNERCLWTSNNIYNRDDMKKNYRVVLFASSVC